GGGTLAPSTTTTLPREAPLVVAPVVQPQRCSDDLPVLPLIPFFPPHVPDAGTAAGFIAAPTGVQIGSSSHPPAGNGAGASQIRTRFIGTTVPASSSPAPAGPRRFRRAVRRRTSNNDTPAPQPLPVILNSGDPPLPPPPNNNAVPAPPPPFPWATSRLGIHRSISELAQLGITTIEGEVQCRRCEARKTISYDIATKFLEVRSFVARHIDDMNDRAPEAWQSPAMADCGGCGQRGSVRAVIPPEKERINWVFLVLGQALGFCTLEQLKHLCSHAKKHRTGAKDRVLYLAYMELLNQLCPDKLFNLTADRQKRTQQFC
ncbi:hypothetical protein BRADI_2g17640v3, partial [Brachypodium distachyon]